MVLSQLHVQGHPPSEDLFAGGGQGADSELALDLSEGDHLVLLTLPKPRAKMKNSLEPSWLCSSNLYKEQDRDHRADQTL